MKLLDTIKQLNANISDVATCEKAKKLRKKLLVGGGIGVAVGIIMVLTGFILFMVAGDNMMDTMAPSMTSFIFPMLLFILGGLATTVSIYFIKAGLAILIGGESSKFIDKTVNDRCECGETIKEGDKFCPKCGKPVRKTCKACGKVNEPSAEYCSECGKKLD